MTASFLTIHYNPFKPSIMAAGCSDRSILLFNTNNLSFSNLYSTLYHMKNEDAGTPSCIETEFEVTNISWNGQNPSMLTNILFSLDLLAASGMSDNNVVGIWDIRKPYFNNRILIIRTLPLRLLEQSQRVKEISWLTHPGAVTSNDYLSVLQIGANSTNIDIFPSQSIPLFKSLICRQPLALTGFRRVATVLNAREIEDDSVSLGENEVMNALTNSIFTH